jgi:ubiquinone/menaquinone biosynthesis C-methylase UbiE
MDNEWQEFWNGFSIEIYDYVNLLPGYQNMINRISTFVGKNKYVLDAGCGTGNLSLKLAPNNYVTAVDFSQKMLQIAKQKLTNCPNVTLKQGDVTSLDFNEKTFDIVVSVNVLYNLDDPQGAIKEAYRVLKEKGVFITSNPHDKVQMDQKLVERVLNSVEYPYKEKVKQLLEYNKILFKRGGMKFTPSSTQIMELFTQNGFRVTQIEKIYYGCNFLIKAIKV